MAQFHHILSLITKLQAFPHTPCFPLTEAQGVQNKYTWFVTEIIHSNTLIVTVPVVVVNFQGVAESTSDPAQPKVKIRPADWVKAA